MKDEDNYKIRMNIKSMITFENLADKRFSDIGLEDLPLVLYAVFIANNDLNLTYTEFELMMKNKKFASWIIGEYSTQTKMQEQYVHSASGEGEEKKMDAWVRDVVSTLIIDYGMDANYVMYRMSLPELQSLFAAAERKREREMEEQRFWTYLQMLPHIDGRKLQSPEKLIKFPWEKGSKEKALQDIENNIDKIKAVLNGGGTIYTKLQPRTTGGLTSEG